MLTVAVLFGSLLFALHWIGCFVVPVLRCRFAGGGLALLWGIGGLVCSPLVVVATQWRRLPTPGRLSWVLRIAFGIAIAVALVKLGDSQWNHSPTMVSLKLSIVKMMSSAHIIVQGNRLIGDGQQAVEGLTFGHAPFSAAAVIAATSMLLYRSPVEKGLILTVGVFCTSVLFDSIGLSRLVLAVNAMPVDEQKVQMLYDTRQLFHFWVPLILFFWATVAWATWDARRVKTEPAEPAANV